MFDLIVSALLLPAWGAAILLALRARQKLLRQLKDAEQIVAEAKKLIAEIEPAPFPQARPNEAFEGKGMRLGGIYFLLDGHYHVVGRTDHGFQ